MPRRLSSNRRRVATRALLVTVTVLGAVLGGSGTLPGLRAQPQSPGLGSAALVSALRQGGHVLLLRHALVEEGTQDQDRNTLDMTDCTVQRPLSEAGRSQARAIGDAVRSLGIPVGAVISSPYCRTLETARLAFGEAASDADLQAFDSMTTPPEVQQARTTVLRRLLATPPAPGTNTVLVTHGKNIRAAVDLALEPGEAAVFAPAADGVPLLLARVLATDWAALVTRQFMPAGTLWVTNAERNTVAVYDTAGGALLATIPVGMTPIGVTASPGTGKAYVTDEGSNQVSVIAIAELQVVATIPTGPRPHHITHSPDGRFVYVAEFGTNTIGVIDTATDTLVAQFSAGPAEARTHAVAVTDNGTTLLAANTVVNTVAALDAQSGTVRWTLPVGANPSEVLPTADGAIAFVTVRNEHKLQLIDLMTPSVIGEVPIGEQPDTLVLTPDGGLLIVALRSRPAQVALVDTATLSVTWVGLDGTTTGHNAISADGRFSFVAVEGPAPGIAVIDHATRAVVATFPYPDSGRPHGVAFVSPARP